MCLSLFSFVLKSLLYAPTSHRWSIQDDEAQSLKMDATPRCFTENQKRKGSRQISSSSIYLLLKLKIFFHYILFISFVLLSFSSLWWTEFHYLKLSVFISSILYFDYCFTFGICMCLLKNITLFHLFFWKNLSSHFHITFGWFSRVKKHH